MIIIIIIIIIVVANPKAYHKILAKLKNKKKTLINCNSTNCAGLI